MHPEEPGEPSGHWCPCRVTWGPLCDPKMSLHSTGTLPLPAWSSSQHLGAGIPRLPGVCGISGTALYSFSVASWPLGMPSAPSALPQAHPVQHPNGPPPSRIHVPHPRGCQLSWALPACVRGWPQACFSPSNGDGHSSFLGRRQWLRSTAEGSSFPPASLIPPGCH